MFPSSRVPEFDFSLHMRNLTRNSGGRHTADWFESSDGEEVLVCTAGWGEIVKCGLEAWLALSNFSVAVLRLSNCSSLGRVFCDVSHFLPRDSQVVNHFSSLSLSMPFNWPIFCFIAQSGFDHFFQISSR